MIHDTVIIGGGPAAFTAGIYLGRAGLKPVIYTGDEEGGQLATTTDVENYPGVLATQGPDLVDGMLEQAEASGAEIESLVHVDRIEFGSATSGSMPVHKVFPVDEEPVEAHTVVIATGAAYRWLHIPGESEYAGRGISWCATCDGAFFQDKNVTVIGGGDSAAEEALYMSKIASQVTLVHRRDTLRASAILQERIANTENITVLYEQKPVQFHGDDSRVTAVELEDVTTGERTKHAVDGVFIAVGSVPNTGFLQGAVTVDDNGFILTRPNTAETNIPGVFAAGDVMDPFYRQAVTAAASGCVAAMNIENYLNTSGGRSPISLSRNFLLD